jgi:hypothetical protein
MGGKDADRVRPHRRVAHRVDEIGLEAQTRVLQRGPVDFADLRLQADLCEKRLHQFRHQAELGAAPERRRSNTDDRIRESVGIAGLGQQRTRALGIVAVGLVEARLQFLDVAVEPRVH